MRVSSSDGPSGPRLDVADDTWLAVPPGVVAAAVAEPARWLRWWPDLELEVTRDRGVKGHQWVARPTAGAGGGGLLRRRPLRWTGSLEVWVEPWRDGVVLHHYARLDPVGPRQPTPRGLERARHRRVLAWKRSVHALKDELEPAAAAASRAPGRHPSGAPGSR